MSTVVKFQAPARIRVEKGVPLPSRQRSKKPCPYPFMDMNVGDSFLIAATEGTGINVMNHIARHKTRFLKENPGPYQFESRRVQGGVRCWRIK